MTEPTQKQIDHEMERAYALVAACYREFGLGMGQCAVLQKVVATALARRALEARDEALKLAEALCHSQDCSMEQEYCGCAYELSERIAKLRDGKR